MSLTVKFTFLLVLIFSSIIYVSAQDKTTKLKIISNPQPAYTEEARKNRISGKVVLVVEFKADGQIGTVAEATDKNKQEMRKYGLVEQAVKAAKRIKFEPATENGKPITQIKTIIIDFRTY